MRYPRFIIAVFAVIVAATIGEVAISSGSSSNSAASATAATGAVAVVAGPAAQATVQTAAATVQGKTETILVDAHGLPLYIYKPDTTTSHVSGHLAVLWPPLVAAAPTASGVTGAVASVATTNGKQVAYNGHFLYTFVQDSRGHVTGQGVQNFFVATPALSAAAASSAVDVAPSTSSYGYGY